MTARAVVGRSRWDGATPWLVALIAVLVYANALQNGFAYDDAGIILRHDLVHRIDGIWRAFVNPYWPTGAGQYRPLVVASFSAEWALWGPDPRGYHAVNLAWHALATALVHVLARRWLSLGGSVVAALLFAVHPVHVEAVANVVGRSELMAACGVLAMLVLHARRSRWAILAFIAAILSKEHAIVAPVLALVLDAAARAPEADAGRARAPGPGVLYAAYGAILLGWIAVVHTLFAGHTFAAVDAFWSGLDLRTRLLTVAGLIPIWARLLVFPADLSADYSPAVVQAWPDNAVMAGLGGVLLVLATLLALLPAMSRRHRVLPVAIAWMVVAILPVSNVLFPTGVIVAERTLYLPSVGAALVLGVAIEHVALRFRTAGLLAVASLLVAGSIRTWVRTPAWKSTQSVLLATAEAHPEASWTHVLIARVYAGHLAHDKALGEYRTALALFPRSEVAWAEAIDLATRSGLTALADSLAVNADRNVPGSYLVGLASAAADLKAGRLQQALARAREAAEARPDSVAPRLLAAAALIQLGEPDSARTLLLGIRPADPARSLADSILRSLPPRP